MFTWPKVGFRTEEIALQYCNLSTTLLCCRGRIVIESGLKLYKIVLLEVYQLGVAN